MSLYTGLKVISKAEMPDLADYLTTQETARVLGFNVKSIYHMVRNQTLESIKVCRSILISKKSLEDYKRRTYGMSPSDPRRKRMDN